MRLNIFILYFFAFLCQHLFQEAASEESTTLDIGNQDIYLDLFNTSTIHRQIFCDEQKRQQRGELEINLALEGRHVNVALGPDSTFVHRNADGSLNKEYPGLMPILMDEVARRGKFTWRNSYFIHGSNVPSDKSWTDMLVWIVDYYDVAVWWWFALYSREALGVSFPKGWYDGSIIIIAKQETENYFDTFSPFSWSKPFTPGVWLFLLATMIVTGIVSMRLDPHVREKAETTKHLLLSNIYSALIVFTGHLDLDPNTHSGQLVSFSLSFFAMLMLSAYTANLASFLVIEKASLSFQVNTVNDIVRMQKTMCIYAQSATQEAVASSYPDALFVEKHDDTAVLLALKNDECDYAILGLSSWEAVSFIQNYLFLFITYPTYKFLFLSYNNIIILARENSRSK